MKPNLKYEFHHMGIPSDQVRPNETFSQAAGMYTADNPGSFHIQWHRFLPSSPLHPLIRTLPHAAFKMPDLAAAIEGEQVILGPYEPIDDFHVAMIDDHGAPVELIQTDLTDDEVWNRARSGQGSIYRKDQM